MLNLTDIKREVNLDEKAMRWEDDDHLDGCDTGSFKQR
jgi:hypothetical protein